MACYKNISTFDMCAQMNLCLYIGQVEVSELWPPTSLSFIF